MMTRFACLLACLLALRRVTSKKELSSATWEMSRVAGIIIIIIIINEKKPGVLAYEVLYRCM